MEITRTVEDTRRFRASLGGRVALVPTMGALHDGHRSLMRLGRLHADRVIVSVFVNPTQFGPGEDLVRYPRSFDRDIDMCEAEGVAGVFAPEADEVYPPGDLGVEINVPELTADLEGRARPGHFAGVCRVCAKLFNTVTPDVAVFGQKDYQQLCVMHAMVRDLMLPIRIIAGPTQRESDGLALSSRNRYLDQTQRRHALGLYKALQQGRYLIENEGEADPEAVEAAMRQTIKAHQIEPDYAVVRHPQTLVPMDSVTLPAVILAAGRLGQVRLLDNLVVQGERAG